MTSTPSARLVDQGADVLGAPDRGLAAELDALGEFAFADARPPRGAADRDQGKNLRQPEKAGIGQKRSGEFHREHPWSFRDARYSMSRFAAAVEPLRAQE